MTGEQARARLAEVLIDTGADVDDTVREILDELEVISEDLDVPVHDSAEFLAWLRS